MGIEHRARLVVGEVGKGFFMLRFRKEQASVWVTGEICEEACLRCSHARADSLCNISIYGSKAFAQLFCVELRDREDTGAALVTSGPAGEPVPRAFGGGSERGVENRKEVRHCAS
jgi:hypothetical protein